MKNILLPAAVFGARAVGVASEPARLMIRITFILLLLFRSASCEALDDISLDLGTITASKWELQGVHLTLNNLNETAQKAGVVIDKLNLPKPFEHLQFVNVQCAHFTLQTDLIACDNGVAELKSNWLQASTIAFSFAVEEQQSRLEISAIKIAGGSVALTAIEKNRRWQLSVTAERLQTKLLKKIYPIDGIDLANGDIVLQAKAEGEDALLRALQLTVNFSKLGAQTTDGKYAAEALAGRIEFHADNTQGLWRWDAQAAMNQGAVYVEPVFLNLNEHGQQPLKIDVAGSYQQANEQVDITKLIYDHPGVLLLRGRGALYRSAAAALQDAVVSIESTNMAAVSEIYAAPFVAATTLEGITLAGVMQADATLVQQQLSKLRLQFQRLDVRDSLARFDLNAATGSINWSDNAANNSQSLLSWEQLKLFDLPFERGELSLTTDAGNVSLNRPADLPLLSGTLHIQQFDLQSNEAQEPDVHFVGKIEQVSLEQLTTEMQLTPLTGSISGEIPGVSFKQGKLSLDGELKIHVFDGEIQIKKLASSGLFSELPQLFADVEITNLDLNQLTSKFSFGNIEGRVTGYVRNLYLENWQPVTFYAWLGTPADDDSRHRISQKAVENIASIGGGGAADLVSRGFLGLFETFGYDRLGLGCYLHNGVCQLMGVEAAEQGYYIVKGGGLPRIDVIGYNPRVDWHVLLRRLQRISQTSETVVE